MGSSIFFNASSASRISGSAASNASARRSGASNCADSSLASTGSIFCSRTDLSMSAIGSKRRSSLKCRSSSSTRLRASDVSCTARSTFLSAHSLTFCSRRIWSFACAAGCRASSRRRRASSSSLRAVSVALERLCSPMLAALVSSCTTTGVEVAACGPPRSAGNRSRTTMSKETERTPSKSNVERSISSLPFQSDAPLFVNDATVRRSCHGPPSRA